MTTKKTEEKDHKTYCNIIIKTAETYAFNPAKHISETYQRGKKTICSADELTGI